MKENSKYYLTALPFIYRKEHYQAITQLRQKELAQMIALRHTPDCYSRFIVNALDDTTATPCGRCANCLGHDVLPSVSLTVSPDAQKKATDYLHWAPTIPIVPRRQWALSSATVRSKIDHINEEGICLCRYGDAGLGELVRQGKYSAEKHFDDELVKRGAEVLRPLIAQTGITQITCVPSLRSPIVANYAQRLASACNVPFAELLIKHSAEPQKNMQNSAHQCANAFQSFDIMAGAVPEEKVLLVDDIVDSRWTLTVCGYRLMEHGCQKVYPFALADSSQQEED